MSNKANRIKKLALVVLAVVICRLLAGAMDGAMSVLIGVAARDSLKSGQPVKIADLLA